MAHGLNGLFEQYKRSQSPDDRATGDEGGDRRARVRIRLGAHGDAECLIPDCAQPDARAPRGTKGGCERAQVRGGGAEFEYGLRHPSAGKELEDHWTLKGAPSYEFGITTDAGGKARIYFRSREVTERFQLTVSRDQWADLDSMELAADAVWQSARP